MKWDAHRKNARPARPAIIIPHRAQFVNRFLKNFFKKIFQKPLDMVEGLCYNEVGDSPCARPARSHTLYYITSGAPCQ